MNQPTDWGPWPEQPPDQPVAHSPRHFTNDRNDAATSGLPTARTASPLGAPLTVGEVLQGAINTVLSGPRVLVGGALLIAGSVQFAVVAAIWFLVGGIDLNEPPTAAAAGRLATAAGVSILGSWAVSVAMTGIGASATAERTAGRNITAASVLPRVRARLRPLLVVVVTTVSVPLLAGVVVGAGAVLAGFVIGGVAGLLIAISGVLLSVGLGLWLAIRLLLAPVAAVLSTGPAGAALAESWRLTGRDFWRVLGFGALNVLITQTVTAVVATPLGVFVSEDPERLSGGVLVAGAVTTAASVTLTAPFTACVTALLFSDLRRLAGGPVQ